MTNEKSINSQKSQEAPTEKGGDLNGSESEEQGTSGQAMSDASSESHVENEATGGVASEDVNSASNVDEPADEPQDPLLAMTAERNDLKDQLLRALADTENMRRRSEREAVNVRKYGHTPFARDLVGAIDNLARAVDSAPDNLETLDETTKSLITGIQLSWTELQSVIEKHGIKRVEPLGEKFDYNFNIIKNDVFRYLKSCYNENCDYNIIFADPPYDLEIKKYEAIINKIFKFKMLKTDGIIILEHSNKIEFDSIKTFYMKRKYGGCFFSFFKNIIN